MADKYNVVEPKVPVGILATIASAIVVVLILVFIAIPSNSEKIYAAYTNTANDYFTENHPYVGIDGNKVERFINNGDTFLLFISSADCESCQTHIGTIEKYFQDDDYVASVDDVMINDLFDEIYYLDAVDDSEGFTNVYENVDGIDDSTPQLVLVIDGEIVLSFNANASTTDQNRNTNVRTFFEDVIVAINEQDE